MPPVISSIPTLEEVTIDINYDLIINKSKLKQNSNTYKLKRPIKKNNNILENTLNLKYV